MNSIFVLGAGFSAAAGLPLGKDLLASVRDLARHRQVEHFLLRDLAWFVEYRRNAYGEELSIENVNLEELVTFLDIEHSLGLKGRGQWSHDGNESQLLIRNCIALLLYQKQLEMMPEQKSLYDDFAERLDPGDLVLTLNYDTILEEALTRVGQPFRLLPHWLGSQNDGTGQDDTSHQEVCVLKMHGSMDWFRIPEEKMPRGRDDDKHFAHFAILNADELGMSPLVFGSLDGQPRLRHIYRAANLEPYFLNAEFLSQAPMLVAPSHAKTAYLEPLSDFFWGINETGRFNQDLSIIGFSLPSHDDYLRQALYSLVRNYQLVELGEEYPKARLKVVDYRVDEDGLLAFKNNYRFVDWSKTDVFWEGFGAGALDFLFD